jgi:hypothetical protein
MLCHIVDDPKVVRATEGERMDKVISEQRPQRRTALEREYEELEWNRVKYMCGAVALFFIRGAGTSIQHTEPSPYLLDTLPGADGRAQLNMCSTGIMTDNGCHAANWTWMVWRVSWPVTTNDSAGKTLRTATTVMNMRTPYDD